MIHPRAAVSKAAEGLRAWEGEDQSQSCKLRCLQGQAGDLNEGCRAGWGLWQIKEDIHTPLK